MDKENRKTKPKTDEEVLAWLLNFEQQAGCSVVISLLIENGGIEFKSMVEKKLWQGIELNEDDVDSDGLDKKEMKVLQKKAQSIFDLEDKPNYIT